MANIYIEPAKAKAMLSQQKALERALQELSRDVGSVHRGLNYKISGREAIDARLRDVVGQINREMDSTKALRTGLEQIINRYEQTENGNTERVKAEKTSIQNGGSGSGETDTPRQPIWKDWLDLIVPYSSVPTIPKPLIPSPFFPSQLILKLVTPITLQELLLTGISTGNSISSNSSVNYEFSDDHPGVTAWVGKVGAKTSGDWGSAGVNAYFGKIEAQTDADVHFMSTNSIIDASFMAGVSGSVFAVDGKAEAGNDYFGAEVSAEGGAFNVTAETKGEFSIGDDGVNANVSGKAMVSALEGKASGTINILGVEITGKIGGYVGAAGVEGEIGIKDNKIVMEGGFAALLGVSGGVEIGFNDTGWSEFWDMVTFWD